MSIPASRTPKRQRKKEGAQARRAAELAAARKQQRTRRVVRIAIVAVIAVAMAFAFSIFGGDDDKKTDSAASTTTTEASTTSVAPVEPPTCADGDGTNTDLTQKPTVPVPAEPATELTCRDLVVGDGQEVAAADTITVQYVGVSQSTGKEFDSSWKRGEPATFSLAEVIPGWTQGITGMKVGGRRLLTIPGDLAYGAQGRPPDIGPNETLVFIVDVTDAKAA
jgi:FKBP-type peptidyl-prolyl cis-trans isomerase